MPLKNIISLSLTLLFITFITACGARNMNTGCPSGDCSEPTETPASGYCIMDADCELGEICNAGICQEDTSSSNQPGPESCSSNNDCSIGLFCDLSSGTCVDCLVDEHCDVGLQCMADNTCGDGSLCTGDADCDGDLVCELSSGACVECTVDSHCPSGSTCQLNSCVESGNSGAPTCTTQADCDPLGYICDLSAGECVPCSTDTQCGDGRVCNAGVCVNDNTGSGGCQFTSECNGLACISGSCSNCAYDFECWDSVTTDMICEAGSCLASECTTADQCPAGLGCWSGRCSACMYDSECRTGEICNSGVCETPTTPECTANIDCSPGQVCLAGSCGACTDSSQCEGLVCNDGACESSSTPGNGPLGASCVSVNDCQTGLSCLGINEENFCTRSCIGSGKGGTADCPANFACYNFDQGGLDGVSICIPSAVMPATLEDGSVFPGQPFDLQPGDSCSAANSGCQTLYCMSETECMRSCRAGRDCNSGETCYGAWVPTTADTSVYEMLDVHYCIGSDTVTYAGAGESCTAGYECDTGLCGGTCSNDNTKMCNSATDCGAGNTCNGTCLNHCRSNADCSAGKVCDGWPTNAAAQTGWVPVCQPKLGAGMLADGVSCSANSDCNSDWCVNNSCTTMCALDTDCIGGLTGKSCQMMQLTDSAGAGVYTAQFCVD